jgi:acyl dehydratase
MTGSFDRRLQRFPESRYFEDLKVGERFYIPSRTMTEAHFAAFQTLSADNHPIHYDIEYCRERSHPGLASKSCVSPRRAPAILRLPSATR